MRRLFFLFAGLIASLPLPAAQVRPELEGNAEYDAATNTVTVTQNPSLTMGTATLHADKLKWNRTTNTVLAEGHVELTDGPRRLLAETLAYDVNTGNYTAQRIRFGDYPLYVSGTLATGTKTSVSVENATIVLRQPGIFAPTVRTKKMTYSAGQVVEAESASLGVGPALPITLPKFTQKLDEPALSYVTLDAGYRSSLGAFVDAGLHIPVAPGLKLGGDIGEYTSRGLLAGPSGSYTSLTDPDSLTGSFKTGYIYDHGDRKNDILGRPIAPDRSYAEWTHQQNITDALSLTAELNYWRDSEIIRDFRPNEFFNVQQPDTYVESVYKSQNYYFSLFARFQPNTYYEVQQRLPELRFDLQPYALGQGIYERMNASFAVLRDTPPTGGTDLADNRLDAYYALTRPVALGDWGNVTPIVGGRLTHYADTEGATVDDGNYTRALGEVGFDAEMRMSGTFNYRNERWGIDGLRHLLTPRISYRYIPEGDQGRRYIPDIDRDVSISSYLPPLGLGDQRNIDDLHAENTLRLGLDNTLQTRDPVYGSRDLLTFNTAADLRFHREPNQRDLSEIHSELAIMPARWLQFDLYESFAPQTFTLHELNTSVVIRDGQAWWLRFSNNFLQHDSEQFATDGAYRLTEAYEVFGQLQYDAFTHLFVSQSYGVRQNLANQWKIEYAVTLYDGPRRESKFGFRMQVDLLKF